MSSIDNITLAERDKYLYQIEKQIEAKRKLLIKKKKHLKRDIKENEFLEAVKEEYRTYFEKIVKETTDEYAAMSKIADHLQYIIDDGIKNSSMNKTELTAARAEHKEIIMEMKKVKHILNAIVD
jgi:hypothetical protein